MKFSEKIAIAQRLQAHHYAFRVFWDMAEIRYDEKINTICVRWNTETYEPSLLINREWWEEMNEESRISQIFTILHECFHVLFNHVYRFAKAFKTGEGEIVNIATDIVINEMLTNQFGFDRNALHENLYNPNDPDKSGCWIDTVFRENAHKIERNKSSDYYIQKLKEMYPEMAKGTGEGSSTLGGMGFDEHSVLSEEEAENLVEALDQSGFMEMLGEEFKKTVKESEESKELEKKGQLAGTGSGNWFSVQIQKRQIKQKWETVVKNHSRRLLATDMKLEERWDRIKPLYSPLMSKNRVKLPFETWRIGPVEQEKKGLIYMFLDCSGSCIHLKDRFFKAARTVDPRKIDLRLFSFDTRTEELDIKTGRVHGGGGTCFRCIEGQIQRCMSTDKTRYPDQVFIITDGDGTSVRPEKPDRWIWFLAGEETKRYIPSQSKIYYLKDFE